MDQGKAVGEKTTHDLLAAVHHEPECDDGRLFVALVPHAAHRQECGLADGLEDAKERSRHENCGEVLARGVDCEDGPPEHDVDAEVLCNR